ncbi:TonB-dependent receptor [Rhizobium sp. CRIBSB]|nr:TonB-dependent receptor [Rhizobium sp. CRIBSB]
MRVLRSLLLITTALLPTSVLAQTADADQETATAVGEIIVTAQRREQALQDVPLSVAAVSAESLEARGVSTLSDFAAGAVQGVQISPFVGSSSTLAISARGLGTGDPTQGSRELPVPLYLDGVPLGRAQGMGLELIDPERIEFLRGPQGQLFGRNASGGAVQFVSRRPSGEFGYDLRLQAGNYGLDSQRLRVDLPEFSNIRLQASIARTQRDGFTENSDTMVYAQQKDFQSLDSLGWRVAAEWNPMADLRLNYSYDSSDVDDTQAYGTWIPVDIRGRTPFSPQPAFNGEYPDRANSPTFNEGFNTKSSGHGLTIQYDLSDAITLKSISSIRETSRHGSGTLGDALVAGGSSRGILTTNAREDVDQEQTYQEFQFLGGWDNFELTFGASYFSEQVDDERRSRISGPGLTAGALGISPATLAGCIGLQLCQTARSEQNVDSESLGIYAQGTWIPSIMDGKLELTAGVRYTDDSKTAQRTYIQPLALPPYSETAPSGPLPPVSEFNEQRWDPAFVVKYNFSDDVNAYFRYATGYKAGGANVRSSQFRSYGSEENESFEIGLKGRFIDRRLTLNIAAYSNTITGFQYDIQEAPTTNPSLTNTVNGAGEYEVKGVELESSFRVNDNLTLSAGYTVMDTENFEEFDNPLTVAVDPSRFYAIMAPEGAGNVAVDYVADVGLGELLFHMDYSFASEFNVTPGGQLVASFGPTYERPTAKTSMLNARLALGGIPAGGSEAEIAVFGKNILDETNQIFGFDGAASGGGFYQVVQPPRQYGLELRLQY